MKIKQKRFEDYLTDDPSLSEKLTYKELCEQKKAIPINEDIAIEKTLNKCIETCNNLEKPV